MIKYEELCSPTAESGIIATILNKPQYIFYSEDLQPEDFADEVNSYLFWGARELAVNGVAQIDDYQMSAILSSKKAVENGIKPLEQKTIQSTLELCEYGCRHSPEEYKLLVKDVLDYKSRRDLYIGTLKLNSACLQENIKSKDLDEMLYALTEQNSAASSRNQRLEKFSDKLDKLWQEQVSRQDGTLTTIPFHIKELNDYVEMEAGELIIFGANAKVGKSAMLLSCTVDLLKKGMSVLVIDSELSDRLYMLRLLAHITQIPFKTVKDGNGTDEEKHKINEAKEWLKNCNLYHEYVPVFNDTEVLNLFKRINHMNKIEVLVVDYFKTTNGADAFSVSLNLSGFVNTVKNEIGGIYGIPIISAIQTTKNGEVALSAGVIRYCSTLVTIRRKTSKEFITDGGADFGNSYMQVIINRNGKQQSEDEYLSVDFIGDTLTYKSANSQPVKQEAF